VDNLFSKSFHIYIINIFLGKFCSEKKKEKRERERERERERKREREEEL